jgi:hypothetical protein
MNSRFAATVLVCVCLTTVYTPELRAQSSTDEQRIRAVLEEYVTGWREGDVERLGRIFAVDEGRILWLSGNPGQETLMSMTFGQALQRRRPQPEYGQTWRILTLDVVDEQLAVAKLDISRAGGSYVDYLVLQKIAGEWRIVTKTYVVRQQQPLPQR